MTITQKEKAFEEAGWMYIHDGLDWTSGSWYHERIGTVNSGGASFTWIGAAVEALERFLASLEQLASDS